MFGFDKFGRKTFLGGDVYLEQRKRRIIITVVFGIIALAIINVILYSLTNI